MLPDPPIVCDDNIGDYSTAQLFFRDALGYADAGARLFATLTSGNLEPTYAHARAAHFLCDHGLELFLKGALIAKGQELRTNHRLDQLYSKYSDLYSADEFGFGCRIDEMVDYNPESPHGLFARYPVDKREVPWGGWNAYTLPTWETQARALRADIVRLVELIEPLPPPALGPEPPNKR